MDMTSSSSATMARSDAAPALSDSKGAARSRARERRRALGRGLRQGALVLCLVGAAVGVVLALRPQPVPVDVAPVTRAPLVVAIEESGKTRVKDRYVVSAPTTGRVARLLLEPGDMVREGATLAEISPTLSPLLDQRTRAETEARLGAALSALGQSKAQVARALTAKEQTERELERTSNLTASGSLPAEAREQAEFNLRLRSDELNSAEFGAKVAAEEARLARAALERSGKDLGRDGHLDVLAPASGRVLTIVQKSAGVVQAGAPLLEVGDPSQLEAVVDLLTTDAVRVRPGTPVEIIDWGGEQRLPGHVRHVEPSAFTRPSALGVDEQRVNVIVTLDGPLEARAELGDGYHIAVRLILWAGDQVSQIPLGAVFRQGNGWACYVVDDGVARLRSIDVGHRGETSVEATQGLALGDVVIVHPGDRVRDGVRVEVH
jgi:HlyD family secretion protein